MEYIDYNHLQSIKQTIKSDWDNAKPFRYAVFEGLFKKELLDEVFNAYPKLDESDWKYTTYKHQNNKYVKTEFEAGSVLQNVFDNLNDKKLLNFFEEITEISPLVADPELFGGGLHQSKTGAFLDVHVDFNIHDKTKYHRRMNLIVFMNKDWKKDYEGFLELWDMNTQEQIGNVSPDINRCVLFETNEVSFHGHPKPLTTPPGLTRKSFALYYYTKERPKNETADEHNTIYVNTEGNKGTLKTLKSGIKALLERINN